MSQTIQPRPPASWRDIGKAKSKFLIMRFTGSDKILLYMYEDSYGKNLCVPNNFISLAPYT
jgi:hypothetical protein